MCQAVTRRQHETTLVVAKRCALLTKVWVVEKLTTTTTNREEGYLHLPSQQVSGAYTTVQSIPQTDEMSW